MTAQDDLMLILNSASHHHVRKLRCARCCKSCFQVSFFQFAIRKQHLPPSPLPAPPCSCQAEQLHHFTSCSGHSWNKMTEVWGQGEMRERDCKEGQTTNKTSQLQRNASTILSYFGIPPVRTSQDFKKWLWQHFHISFTILLHSFQVHQVF